jgi:hypothetical protein
LLTAFADWDHYGQFRADSVEKVGYREFAFNALSRRHYLKSLADDERGSDKMPCKNSC